MTGAGFSYLLQNGEFKVPTQVPCDISIAFTEHQNNFSIAAKSVVIASVD